MGEVNLVSGMFNTLQAAITNMVSNNFESLYAVIFPIWTTGVMIHFVIIAWGIIYGEKQMIVSEFINHFLVISLVTVFMGLSGVYTEYVVTIVMGAGSDLAGLVVENDGDGIGGLIDEMIQTVMDIGAEEEEKLDNAGMWDKIGSSLMYFFKMAILIISAGLFILHATSYLIIAVIMVGILLSLGGVFIGFAAFPATRSMFTAWVGSCFNYIFLNVAYAILFSILIEYLNLFIENSVIYEEGESGFWYIVMVGFTFAVGSFLLQQVASLISLLTGGVGINGLTGSVNNTVGKMASATGLTGAAKGLGGMAGGMAMKGAKGGLGLAGRGISAAFNKATNKGGMKGG